MASFIAPGRWRESVHGKRNSPIDLHLEYKLETGSPNNGVRHTVPTKATPPYMGMEIQVLDDTAPNTPISAPRNIAARSTMSRGQTGARLNGRRLEPRGNHRPGRHIKVILNGKRLLMRTSMT